MEDVAIKLKNKEKKFSCAIFPEGTRGDGINLLPFKLGAFKLAKETGTVIQPIVIGSHKFYADKGYLPISILGNTLIY